MRKSNFLWDFLSWFAEFVMQQALFWGWIFTIKFLYVLMGALFGWVTGWFFGSTILGIMNDLGISGYSMWQLGAFLGFVGSFFGSTNQFNKHIKENDTPRQMPTQRYY